MPSLPPNQAQTDQDEMVVEYQRNRDPDLIRQIIEGQDPAINQLLRRLYGFRSHADDLRQEARLALLSAVDRYDITKGFHFRTYAQQVMWGHMLHYLRDFYWPISSRTQQRPRMVSIEQELNVKDPGTRRVNDLLAVNGNLDEQVALCELFCHLTKPQRAVLYLYGVVGLNQREIAGKLGTYPKRISLLMVAARRRVKEILMNAQLTP